MDMTNQLDEEFREACCNGNTDLIQKLISKGVDVNSQNKINGWTSLHWAAKRGHEGIVKSLLQNNANASLKNSKGENAADVAGNDKIRSILLDSLEAQGLSSDSTTGSNNSKSSEKPPSEQINFIPNYLKHPVFPHVKSSQSEQSAPPEINREREMYEKFVEINKKIKTDIDELVLKVRLENDKDFIEVELQNNELTYDNLLDICCTELEFDRRRVIKVRKLPNTIIRKDKDVKRLEQFQEIELIV